MADSLAPPRSLIPNIVTATNVAAGFLSMLLAADGRFEAAVYLLFAAIFLDMLDGRLARLLHATSSLGQQLDSFCDFLSFGCAPAFLVHRALLRNLGPAGALVAIAYLLAGLYRLARFNLRSDPHTKARRTLGVPIPIAAGYLMAVVLMRDEIPAPAAVAVVLLMTVMMISRWRLPDLKGKSVVSALLLVGILNYTAVICWPSWYTVIWWNVWNALILVAARAEDRREAALDVTSSP